MRRRILPVSLALTAICASNFGCGEEEPASPVLARAAEKTLDAGGARFVSSSFAALVDWSVRIRERGVMDAEGSTDLVYWTFTRQRGAPQRTGVARQRLIGDTSYVRRLPRGSWTRIDTGRTPFRASSLLGTGPAALDHLPFLRQVRRIGQEDVRRVRTVRYTVETPLHRISELAVPSERKEVRRELQRLIGLKARGRGLRTDAWVDGKGRVRRVRERLSLRLPGYHRRPSQATTDYISFGPQPRIEAPPNATKDLSALAD